MSSQVLIQNTSKADASVSSDFADTSNMADTSEFVYRALATISDVISKATDEHDLHTRVCCFLVEQGAFAGAAIMLPRNGDTHTVLASAGSAVEVFCETVVVVSVGSADANQSVQTETEATPPGLDSIDNRSGNGPIRSGAYGRVAAIPIQKNGMTTSELVIQSFSPDCFDRPLLRSLQSVARAIAEKSLQLAIEVSHAENRRMMIRLQHMFAALSATNEAILRTKAPEELYQRVCDAAVNSGKFTTTMILKPCLETGWMQTQAMTSVGEEMMRNYRMSIYADIPEGQGTVGIAYRTGRACLRNNMVADPRLTPWRERAIKAGIAAVAAVPMVRNGQAIGVMLFHSRENMAFDEETVKLLEGMAENVIFALDNFEREAERKASEERIKHLATHDGLTGLPNRVMFSHLLDVTLQAAKRYQRRVALLFIDLDRFKFINDTLGHDAGDTLLKEIAFRFRQTLRSSDAIARLGGDEFVLLIQEMNHPDQAAAVAQKILAAATEPIMLGGQECRISASVGIAMFPDDGGDEQSLTKSADVAMYHAKQEGKNNYQFFSQNIKAQSTQRAALEANLRLAIERNELLLHYQPKIDLLTGAITGVEALLRWRSASHGDVSPAEFLAVAEETGLIVPIGLWTLRQACLHNMGWQRQGIAPVRVAVNLSTRQLSDDSLLRNIALILKDTGMPADLLELEITESMVIHNPELTIRLLTAIKLMGIRVAIDDFGTGYSLLRQLTQFPIDTLKVDRSFVHDLDQHDDHRAIAQSMIAMGKTLSTAVVAKGVETIAQKDFLRDNGCDQMQGFYFSNAVSADEFALMMREPQGDNTGS